MLTKETCAHKYDECKLSKNGSIPKYREFLTYAGIDKRQLERLFGSSAYSKLQNAAGDAQSVTVVAVGKKLRNRVIIGGVEMQL